MQTGPKKEEEEEERKARKGNKRRNKQIPSPGIPSTGLYLISNPSIN
jgi:hypothetical protein